MDGVKPVKSAVWQWMVLPQDFSWSRALVTQPRCHPFGRAVGVISGVMMTCCVLRWTVLTHRRERRVFFDDVTLGDTKFIGDNRFLNGQRQPGIWANMQGSDFKGQVLFARLWGNIEKATFAEVTQPINITVRHTGGTESFWNVAAYPGYYQRIKLKRKQDPGGPSSSVWSDSKSMVENTLGQFVPCPFFLFYQCECVYECECVLECICQGGWGAVMGRGVLLMGSCFYFVKHFE